MIYFTLKISGNELARMRCHVDPTVFCLWHEGNEEDLFGVIKETAYEFFIVACSLLTVQSMTWLPFSHFGQTSGGEAKVVVCGNRNLLADGFLETGVKMPS